MSIRARADELRKILGAQVSEDFIPSTPCYGLEYDSRNIRGGELFVALPGEHAHGENFLDQAFAKGASLALVESASMLKQHAERARLLQVPSSLAAFSQLASWWRSRLGYPIIGITGSLGKTTVKEMLVSILLKSSVGGFSKKSFNNHVGVPYTICGLKEDHAWAVLEMGMNHPGELAELSQIAKPDVAAVTWVQPSHIGFFSSLAEIADAKAEIFSGLASGRPAIIRFDDQEIRAAMDRRGKTCEHTLVTFGEHAQADVRIGKTEALGLEGIRFELSMGSEQCAEHITVHMKMLGVHNAYNAACAAALARAAFPNLALELIKQGLEEFQAPLMRLQLRKLRGGRCIIDDSYNASPTSMKASLGILRDLKAQGKRVAVVLGAMRELGDQSQAYHEEIGAEVAGLSPDFFVAVGEAAAWYQDSARKAHQAQHSDSPNSPIFPIFACETPVAAAHIAQKIPFDVLLVKASRGVGLDKTVETLLEYLPEDLGDALAFRSQAKNAEEGEGSNE